MGLNIVGVAALFALASCGLSKDSETQTEKVPLSPNTMATVTAKPNNARGVIQLDTTNILLGNDTIAVAFNAFSDLSTQWIGLYTVGAEDRNFIKKSEVTGKEGTISFSLPSTLGTGNYELRAFSDKEFTRIAESKRFQVSQRTASITRTTPVPTPTPTSTPSLTPPPVSDSRITLNSGNTYLRGSQLSFQFTSFPNNSSQWFTIAEVGSPPNTYGDWDYISGVDGTGTLSIGASLVSGSYEIRGFKDGGYTLQSASPSFVVP